MNFAHRVLLIEGELARIDGRTGEAVSRFDEAIRLATAGEWTGEIAVGHELRARVSENAADAERHRRTARDVYDRWGARVKVALLDSGA